MMKRYKIVVLPGDGIGPEIVDATVRVLSTVQRLSGRFHLEYEFHSVLENIFKAHNHRKGN